MMKQERLRIRRNKKIAEDHFVMDLESPRIAKQATPGQFIQIQADESHEPLLPRPFSFLDTTRNSIQILYQVVGSGTALLSQKKPGEFLKVLGPLGKPFSRPKSQPVILIGGGVGIPPLYHLAAFLRKQNRKQNIHVFLGARKKAFLHCERDFKALKIPVTVSTDDGSKGVHGVITQPLKRYLSQHASIDAPYLFTCGPTPMLKAVSRVAEEFKLDCEVSVEEAMPCGFGACLGCAIKVTANGHPAAGCDQVGRKFRYAISCCEGPVFLSKEILWD